MFVITFPRLQILAPRVYDSKPWRWPPACLSWAAHLRVYLPASATEQVHAKGSRVEITDPKRGNVRLIGSGGAAFIGR